MAFETVQIRSTRDGGTPLNGYREDLLASETVGLALTSNLGVATYRWTLVGRPEGSSAGGAGPEPVLLGTAATASFVVDTDATYRKDGTYVVECLVNAGTPTETRIRTLLARLSGLTISGGRALRKPGAFESLEDPTGEGWATQINRWLEYMRGAAATGGASTALTFLTVDDETGALPNSVGLATLSGPGLLKFAADGTPSKAVAGTDYQAPMSAADATIVFDTPTTIRVGTLPYQAPMSAANGTIVFPTADTVRVGVLPNAFVVGGTADASLSGAQFLGALGTGLLKNTTTTGTLSIAVGGTDFENPLTFAAPLSRATNTVSVSTNGISNALFRQSTALSVVGNPTASTANVQDIIASADGQVLTRVSGTLLFAAPAAVNLVVANVTALEALAAGSFTDGTRVRVQNLQRDFYLFTSAASAVVDHQTVASVNGLTADARWVGREGGLRYWWSTDTWYVDPSAGLDTNNGATSGTALRTMAELARRLRGREVSGDVTVNLLGDVPDSDPAVFDLSGTYQVGLVINGVQGVAASGTVASAVAPDYANNVFNDVTISGFDWSTHVGKLVRLSGTSGDSGTYATVLADLGSGTARLSVRSVAGVASLTGFTAGQVVQVLSLPRLPYLTTKGVFTVAVTDCTVGPASASDVAFWSISDQAWLRTARCNVRPNVTFQVNGDFVWFLDVCGVYSANNDVTTSGGMQVTSRLTGFADTGWLLWGEAPAWYDVEDCVFYHSPVTVGTNSTLYVHGSVGMGVGGLASGQVGVKLEDGASGENTALTFGSSNHAASYLMGLDRRASFSFRDGNRVTGTAGVLVGSMNGDGVTATNSEVVPVSGVGRWSLNVQHDARGPSVVSAGNLTLPGASVFASFKVTGATTLQRMSLHASSGGVCQLEDGRTVTLVVQDGLTVAHGASALAGYGVFALRGNVDAVLAAGSRITFELNAGNSWVEVRRTDASGTPLGVVTNVSAALPLTSSGGTSPTLTLNYDATTLTLNAGTTLQRGPLVGDVSALPGSNTVTVPALAAHFWTDRAESTLANEVNLGALTTGLLKITVSGGVATPSTAVAGVDFQAPGAYISALTGEVTATGPGSVAATIANGAVVTAKLADTAVTFAKMQSATAASRLVGRGSASGAGPFQEITVGTGLSLTGTVLSATGGGGTVTAVNATLPLTSTGGTAPTLAINYDGSSIVLNGSNQLQFRQSAALSVVGNGTNATTNVADITAGTDGHVLRRSGATLAFGTISTTAVAAGWPAASTVMVSTGTTTPPTGDTNILVDTTAHELYLASTSAYFSHYRVTGANYERARSRWETSGVGGLPTYTVGTEKLGTGSPRDAQFDATRVAYVNGTSGAYLTAGGSFNARLGVTPDSGSSGGLDAYMSFVRASSAGLTYDAFTFAGDLSVSGTTAVTTATGVNMIRIRRPTYDGQSLLPVKHFNSGSTVYIENSPLDQNGIIIDNSYALWVDDGNTRLDGNLFVGDGVTVNGVTAPTNSALAVGHTNNVQRDHVHFYVGGNTASLDNNNAYFDVIPTGTPLTVGITPGIFSTMRIHGITYSSAGGTPNVGTAVSLYIEGPSLDGVTGTPWALYVDGRSTLQGNSIIGSASALVGFYGNAGSTQSTVTGSRGGNAALASLITQLAATGLVLDGTSP